MRKSIQVTVETREIKDRAVQEAIRTLVAQITRECNQLVRRDEGEAFGLLVAPNGATYKIIVDNAGALHTAIYNPYAP
jgi:hypothetical protein